MITEKILKILARTVGMDYKELTDLPQSTKLSDIGLDSLPFIHFIVALEQELKIEILDSDLMLDNFDTIKALLSTLSKYFTPKPLKKVLICDCDNVLWRGIAGEEEIYCDSETERLQNAITGLEARGVLICLCSRNQEENITAAFESLDMPLKSRHILLKKVNFIDKASNIREIASELNLLPESFVFLDDSDYELGLVAAALPEITVIKAASGTDYINELNAEFSGAATVDIDRTKQYRQQKERFKAQGQFTNVADYNASLQTVITCGAATKSQAKRIAELSLRTNQFNLSAVRYTAEDILGFLSSENHAVYALSLADRYGDMGLVGAAVVENDIITGFFISCRVFGRDAETALLNEIKKHHKGVFGIFRQNKKNSRFAEFYSKNGVTLYG